MVPIVKKMLALLLLAVRWCSSSAPLSLIQRQISTVYYFGTAVPPKVIPWYSKRINCNLQFLIINNGEAAAYAVRETISHLNWLIDDIVQGNRYDIPAAFRVMPDDRKLFSRHINPDRKASGATCPVSFI